MKDIEKCSSDELKGAIQMRSAELPEGGSQETHDNIGYVYDEPDAEEELEEGEERVEASEPEEVDPVVEYLERLNQEKLQGMDLQQRSFYKRVVQEQSKREATATLNDFQTDAEEFASKYSDFPQEVGKFASDFRWGRVEPLTEEELASSSSPQEEMFFKWLNKQRRIPSERIKGIVELYHSGPKLKTRIRDRVMGYQPQRKMSDDEIDQEVGKLFEE